MDEMDVIYDKNSLQAEMVYNQGFSMNAWIGETWGLDANARIWHETGLGFYPTYRRTIRRELGVDRETLYNQWKAYITAKYNKQIAEALNISHTGACQRLREARKELHRLLTGQGDAR